ncbi:MAG: helix-turn-helix transcriptional regulator [Bifidobacterium tibiigranuli]|jgi:predicted transcriptional regulator YheO|nr:helix-turn-helix transcriptional regulator [Bifidobacterium tibiigranuli]MCI1796984.1 helix-turn-helix transcriptional regulator [Bifidobacterium tibiigranuli]
MSSNENEHGIPPRAVFNNIDEVYAVAQPLMKAVAETFGPKCEVVLHDLSEGTLDHTVYAIYNGSVSGRRVGGPSTNLGIEVLDDPFKDHDEFGYRAVTDDGRELRSSSVYFKNKEGRIIAAFCINYDLTPIQTVYNAAKMLIPDSIPVEKTKERVSQQVGTVLDDMITNAIAATHKTPTSMEKPDRLEVLTTLEKQGAFRIKSAATLISRRLGVSRVTIYSYLDEIRKESASA